MIGPNIVTAAGFLRFFEQESAEADASAIISCWCITGGVAGVVGSSACADGVICRTGLSALSAPAPPNIAFAFRTGKLSFDLPSPSHRSCASVCPTARSMCEYFSYVVALVFSVCVHCTMRCVLFAHVLSFPSFDAGLQTNATDSV